MGWADWIAAAYGDPLFVKVPLVSVGLSLSAFLAFALPLTWLAWRDPAPLRRWRVQAAPFPIARYFWPSAGRVLANNAVMLVAAVAAWPALRLAGFHDGPPPPLWLAALQILGFVFLDDALYYGLHRLMHRPWALRHVHGIHHRIRTPFALTGNYMHWAEFTATGSLMLLGPALVGAHVWVLWAWVVIRQFEAADGHCGYVFPWNPGRIFPLYEGGGYHDFHHSHVRGNYAGFLPYLDRFFGSHVPAFLAWRQARRANRGPT